MVDREEIKRTLNEITKDIRTESAWLHTISYLEFTGARKISRTVAKNHPSLDVLDHLADETRHAYAFKKLAVQLSNSETPPYLKLDHAKTMFYVLDRQLSEWVRGHVGEDEFLNYLLVTTMIERRAMQIYPLYRAATSHTVVQEELSAIILEEQGHRVALEEACLEILDSHGLEFSECEAIEARAFGDFWLALQEIA